MAYSELIKNFEKIRAYMREFYVYGFKSRGEYDKKSARSYDDERRRIESWLGDYMNFTRTADGKNIFISIDSRTSEHNPLYRAFKAKSFTDGDITLHFILFDILSNAETYMTLPEIISLTDEKYLSLFDEPMVFDESTVRKKLNEYKNEGIIISQKRGRVLYYRRNNDVSLSDALDALDFYSEIAPCGVIGSFLLDKAEKHRSNFSFKHHYITSAIDSDILTDIFLAMREHRIICAMNHYRKSGEPKKCNIVPLRVFISVQNGIQYLIAYSADDGRIQTYRIDYLANIKFGEPYRDFDALRSELDGMQSKMWGVNLKHSHRGNKKTEHVEFTVFVQVGEEYIAKRLKREKRVGRVDKIGDTVYRFSADVYDTLEMIPWIRTFISRIMQINFSNKVAEDKFKDDLKEMYSLYGMNDDGGDI